MIPLTVLHQASPRLRTLYQTRFALIRPDQHVAWRGDVLPDAARLLQHVTGQVPAARATQPHDVATAH